MIRWSRLVVLGVIATTVACSSSGGSEVTAVQPSTGADNGPDIESGPDVDETADEDKLPLWFATAETATCPTGATFDQTSGFCTQGGRALGPFPAVMVTACKNGGGTSCDDVNWDLAQATRFRGTSTCPTGTTIDGALGVCVESGTTYGPFSQTMVDDCNAAGGGDACSGLRFGTQFVSQLPVQDDGTGITTQDDRSNCSGINARMASYYGSRQGYDNISRAAMRTLGTRHNGCATWLSTAIRQAGGTNIPIIESTDGLRDSLKQHGWTVIRNRADLRPGDVIVTHDRAGRPGHPDHVYMFDGWDGSNPRAVDNQGFAHTRRPGKSPIAYGLRAPSSSGGSCNTPPANQNDASAPTKDSCGGKNDGWYCSEQASYSAYHCQGGDIIGGWQCSDNTVCRPNGSGQATLSGQNPGCFGSR